MDLGFRIVRDAIMYHRISNTRVHSVTEPPLGGSRDLGAFFATLPEKLFSDPFCSIFFTLVSIGKNHISSIHASTIDTTVY